MKHCKKSSEEPESLRQFRIDRPSDNWDQYRDFDPSGYRQLRITARTDQGGLCAYCELTPSTTNEQIAHFHPKSDKTTAHNWALDWQNMWFACLGGTQIWNQDPREYKPPLPQNCSCDQCKSDNVVDNSVFAPNEIPLFPRIFRFEQWPGQMLISVDEPACNAHGVSIEKARLTIKTFNLNCSRLSEARLGMSRQLERAKSLLRESSVDPRKALAALATRHLERDGDGNLPMFFTMIRWHFGRSAEDYLHSITYEG